MFTFSSPIHSTETLYSFATSNNLHSSHPTTPSPLRTSKYANLMTPPHSTQKKSPTNALSATTPRSSSNKPTEFSTRAVNSTPANTLARHAVQGRDKKRSEFLDRIRRRRDDTRAEGTSDQVLRMDFVRERRGWEEQMRRVAILEQGTLAEQGEEDEFHHQGESAMDMETETEAQAELSPTEEFDMENHADWQGYLDHQDPQQLQDDDDDDDSLDLDPDEFDQLFLEALSQHQTRDPGGWTASQQQETSLVSRENHLDLPSHFSHPIRQPEPLLCPSVQHPAQEQHLESSMDLS